MTNKKVDIMVSGMTCASCSSRVERDLSKSNGVKEATVNLLAERATIEYDDEDTNPENLVKVIEDAGFKVPLDQTVLLVEGMT